MRPSVAWGRYLLKFVQLVFARGPRIDDESFLEAAYQAFLLRDPDEEGMSTFLGHLKDGTMTRLDVLRSISISPEFKEAAGLSTQPNDALHLARMALVRECLPPAQVIIDLGGASSQSLDGALLVMGYTHHPQQITIVDLPPAIRAHGPQGPESAPDFFNNDGVHIRYLYASMTDLSAVEDASTDMVWSGESIEHVTEDEADQVCQEAYRVLKPGGHFCMDTPNAILTRLQSPTRMLHPEHKIEYRLPELREKLERWGFRVVETKGICPMPESVRNQQFSPREMVTRAGLSDRAEESYLFYLHAIKPS